MDHELREKTKGAKDKQSAKGSDKSKILFRDECYAIQGAAFAVYRELGCGFLEAVYQECLAIEFTHKGIPFEEQKELQLSYRGKILEKTYRPDFICYGKIIVEIKATKDNLPEYNSQLLNYLHISKYDLGLLINFGSYPKATVIRMINAPQIDFRER